jgi:SPP1 family predicted phage head-tail adaptor
MALEAGRLRHLVAIQQYVPGQNQQTGEPLNDNSNWPTEASGIFAEVRTLSGRDYVLAQQAGYTASHQVTIRWRPGIKPKTTRFVYQGVPLYVVHPNDLEGLHYGLEVLCQSGDAL